jgi:hypothetical protein
MTLGKEAQEELRQTSNEQLVGLWQSILLGTANPRTVPAQLDPELLRMSLENLLDLYSRGVASRNRELSSLKRKIQEQTQAEKNSEPSAPQGTEKKPSDTYPVRQPSRYSLDVLRRRRENVGPIGSIDFLIAFEQARIDRG